MAEAVILHMVRFLLRVKPPKVSRAEALEIVRSECQRRGWPCMEPVHIREGIRRYEVMTNAGMLGGNVFMRIDTQTGKVLGASFARR